MDAMSDNTTVKAQLQQALTTARKARDEVALLALRFTRIPLLLVAAKYALSTVRAARGATGHDLRFIDRAAWGVSCVAASVPGAIGAARYLLEARRGRQPHIIEYK